MNPLKKFYAKLLLFGEYTVIHHAEALAIPYHAYSGRLSMQMEDSDRARSSNQALQGLSSYLLKTSGSITAIDAQRFRHDVEAGMWFDSNIPLGYGVGSSGALVAAVYDAYATDVQNSRPGLIKQRLANLESYFHDSSSGLDPLVSYLHQTIHLISEDNYEKSGAPKWNDDLSIFLLDTGSPRQTSVLVKKYLARYQESTFKNMVDTELAKANHAAINAFLSTNAGSLMQHLETISQLQYEHFKPMLGNMEDVWKQGLESGKYLLKLCGAGGGGFVLGFSKSEKNIPDLPNVRQLVWAGFDE